jgi:UPF0755 protein
LAYIVLALAWWIKIPRGNVIVNIPSGSSLNEIGRRLEKEGVISSSKFFTLASRISGKAKKFRAGSYEMSRRNSIFKVINYLAAGKSKYIRVTIPEGFTAQQVAERLAGAGVTDKDNFLKIVEEKNLEGYLFPETYYFEYAMPEAKAANKMVEQFNVHFTSGMKERAGSIKNMNENKIVILASIIEKEAAVPSERPIISSVFYNRLKKHMYLESCATVLYAIGEHKEKLSLKDLQANSPYNTYRHYGLPPGPICNPGIESLKAALYPVNSDDLFFVVKGSGTHAFSKYFKEHVKNKSDMKKHRRIK